ncbi:bacterial type II and III secretion system family protein, partial [Streptomyces coelicoflavus ZG0656]
SVILTGTADSPAQAAQAAQVARAFVSAPEKVINMISVAGSDQVTLKVRVVEVQRSSLKQLGFNADILKGSGIHSYGFSRPNTYGVNGAAAGGGGLCYNQTGGRTTNGTSTVSSGSQTSAGSNASASQTWTGGPFPTTVTVTDVNGNLVQVPGTALAQASTGSSSAASVSNAIQDIASTAFRTMTGTNATGCLEAFERVGLARTLAEPNLTSVNGESANFLAGASFPCRPD